MNYKNYLCKFIKFLIYSFSFGCFGHYVYKIYIKWKIEPEILTRESLIPSYEVPMPAVTICPPLLTKVSKINLTDITKKLERKVLNLRFEKNFKCFLPLLHACALDIRGNALPHNMFSFVANATSIAVLSECSLEIKELFTKCAHYNYETVKASLRNCKNEINRLLTHFGYCFTWNMLNLEDIFNENVITGHFGSSDKSSYQAEPQWTLSSGYVKQNSSYPMRASIWNNVAFTWIIDNDDTPNMCINKFRSNSFLVSFHLPNEIPTIFHGYDAIEVGKSKIMQLSAKVHSAERKSLKSALPDSRKCYFEGERKLKFFKSYTKTLCEFECLTNYTESLCGCISFSMPRTKRTKICEFINSCPKLAYSHLNVTECKCFEPCIDIEYYVTFDKTTDHSGNIRRELKNDKSFVETSLDFHVNVHQIKKVEKFAPYGLQDFIADCGGLSGIFLGFSMITALEIVHKCVGYLVKKATVTRIVIINALFGVEALVEPNQQSPNESTDTNNIEGLNNVTMSDINNQESIVTVVEDYKDKFEVKESLDVDILDQVYIDLEEDCYL